MNWLESISGRIFKGTIKGALPICGQSTLPYGCKTSLLYWTGLCATEQEPQTHPYSKSKKTTSTAVQLRGPKTHE